ncbi:hypothetical protein RP726_04330 [Candidatus Methylospira mobilis]|uniref:hypothetical protein n=1 Tax=Candidatus Methylospira mobilis TaxID=1808979 RepID=UPI001D16FE60|nr:hypothetical protein [Candidatus Methylospira mobilis]WNV05652.1 hypothetical protein RP726_04330 [Candidatus Methylospira mobilis]
MTVKAALEKYQTEVTPTKRQSTQSAEVRRAAILIANLGKYSLIALTAEIIAQYRDERLAGDLNDKGERVPRSNSTVRLELALLGHMFTVATKEWGLGLTYTRFSTSVALLPAQGETADFLPKKNSGFSKLLPRTQTSCWVGLPVSPLPLACVGLRF